MKCLSCRKNWFFYFKPFLGINEDWSNQKQDNARDTTLGYIEKILQHLLEDSYYSFLVKNLSVFSNLSLKTLIFKSILE